MKRIFTLSINYCTFATEFIGFELNLLVIKSHNAVLNRPRADCQQILAVHEGTVPK